MLLRYLHDERYPFGHGFVVASLIAGIPVSDWCPGARV
jgi:hypothetical protein